MDIVMEDALFIPTFSFFTKPTEYLMMQVPIILCGDVLYGHQTKTMCVFLNQTQLSQGYGIHSQNMQLEDKAFS
jgi:hypothetical protein